MPIELPFWRRRPERSAETASGTERAAGPERTGGADAARRLALVRAYHRATQHGYHAFARGPHDLDWATQPDPFRRYAGARLLALDHVPLEPELGDAAAVPRYDRVFAEGAIAPARLDRRSVSRLFEDSLALSAWKQYGGARWALRINPSSGNLHPTEAYLVAGAVERLCSGPLVAHYAPREHALEVRADVPDAIWRELQGALPPETFFVGLTSIHWREAWKYGERAWRYCQHDAGHAIAAIAIAAAGLGWRTRACESLGHADLVRLLGLDRPGERGGAEPEEPDVLLAILPSAPGAGALPAAVPEGFAGIELAGTPNALSPDHVEWSAIDAVAEACRKPRGVEPRVEPSAPGLAARPAPEPREVRAIALREILRRRRSAVAFDGRTEIERDAFYAMLARTLPGEGRVPFGALPPGTRVHLGLQVHRVRGLAPGLYLLARDPRELPLLRSALERPFVWERPPGCPPELELRLLLAGDARSLARSLACHQEIASDGCFSLAMLCEFDPALEQGGAWIYPRLFWETGAVGQVLYLEAEAAGIRATGIGCFFDEPAHQSFGLASARYRSLYHFTVGGPVEDTRLTTHPPYPPLDRLGGAAHEPSLP